MSWHFSRALVEGYSQGIYSDGVVCALLNEMSLQDQFSCSGKTISFSHRSRYGMMFALLTESVGEELLTWYLGGFHVKPIPTQLVEKMLQTISGRRCGGSWQMSIPGTYLPRTSKKPRLSAHQTTLSKWVTRQNSWNCQRQTWVLTTFGKDAGYLHTPTCTANYSAPSMQKWPACREFVRVFGIPTPMNHEWLMGWPIGCTDLEPLEMDRFRRWQQQHGEF